MGEGVRLWSTRAGKMAWSEFPPGPCAMRFRGNLRPGPYSEGIEAHLKMKKTKKTQHERLHFTSLPTESSRGCACLSRRICAHFGRICVPFGQIRIPFPRSRVHFPRSGVHFRVYDGVQVGLVGEEVLAQCLSVGGTDALAPQE